MTCKGICTKYQVTKQFGKSWYEGGNKMCTVCDIFIRYNDVRCPCCNFSLRTRPRNNKNNRQFDEKQGVKRI